MNLGAVGVVRAVLMPVVYHWFDVRQPNDTGILAGWSGRCGYSDPLTPGGCAGVPPPLPLAGFAYRPLPCRVWRGLAAFSREGYGWGVPAVGVPLAGL